MLVFTVVSLLVLAFGQLAALVSIILRYAFPNAPIYFRIAMLCPLWISTATAFVLSWAGLTGVDVILNLDTLSILLIFFTAKACLWWVFVFYHFWPIIRDVMREGLGR